jgi:hypothetical protein
LLYIGNGILVLMTPQSLIPKYKLDLKNVINCEAIRNTMVVIYSPGEELGGPEHHTIRIKFQCEEGCDEALRAAAVSLKKHVLNHAP